MYRTKGNTYMVAELDSTVAKLHIVAFCLILYFPHSHLTVLILCLVETVEAEPEDAETLKNSHNNTEDLDNSALDLTVNVEPSRNVVDCTLVLCNFSINHPSLVQGT